MNDIFLNFVLHFNRDRDLDQGRLRIDSLSEGNLIIWTATSSIATKQDPESFHYYGGLLPPDYRGKGKLRYHVQTNPIWLPVKGVEGNFYQITPHHVITDKNGKRSDFGIHLDANVPGSLGCIVMSGNRFVQFENWMSRLQKQGYKKLPLFVTYS